MPPCPTLQGAGFTAVATGKWAPGRDRPDQFFGTCQYGTAGGSGPSVQASVVIGRSAAYRSRARQQFDQSAQDSAKAGAARVVLTGSADGAYAIVGPGGVVLAAYSRNASIDAAIAFVPPVTTQAGLDEHRGDLSSLLAQLVGGLRS